MTYDPQERDTLNGNASLKRSINIMSSIMSSICLPEPSVFLRFWVHAFEALILGTFMNLWDHVFKKRSFGMNRFTLVCSNRAAADFPAVQPVCRA